MRGFSLAWFKNLEEQSLRLTLSALVFMFKLAQSDFLFEATDFEAERLFTLPLIDLRPDLDRLFLLLTLFGVAYLLLYY